MTYTPGWFGEMETELRRQVRELERDLTKEAMAAHDVDAPAVEIAGIVHRRVLRAEQTYMTTAGPVTAERWLYRAREDDTARRRRNRTGRVYGHLGPFKAILRRQELRRCSCPTVDRWAALRSAHWLVPR